MNDVDSSTVTQYQSWYIFPTYSRIKINKVWCNMYLLDSVFFNLCHHPLYPIWYLPPTTPHPFHPLIHHRLWVKLWASYATVGLSIRFSQKNKHSARFLHFIDIKLGMTSTQEGEGKYFRKTYKWYYCAQWIYIGSSSFATIFCWYFGLTNISL